MADEAELAHPRRRAYLTALPLTLSAVGLTYLVELSQGSVDPFNRVVLPLLAVLLGLLALGHALGLLDLRRVERGFFAAASLAYFGKFGFTLLSPYAPFERAHELSQIYIWTPFIYALAFLAGTPRASRYRAGGVYLVSVGVGLAAALLGLVGGLRSKIGKLHRPERNDPFGHA